MTYAATTVAVAGAPTGGLAGRGTVPPGLRECVGCEGMDIPRLTHVRVNVRDLPASIDWYERLLGVTAQGHWPPEDPTYVHFTVGPSQLALGRYEPAPATGVRLNFEVE